MVFFNILLIYFSEWKEVDEKFKIQEAKCIMIVSIGIQKLTKMKYAKSLLYLFHCDMLLLSVLDTISKESHELKSLEERSKCFIDVILEDVKEITVCILLHRVFFFYKGYRKKLLYIQSIRKQFVLQVFDFALSIMNFVRKNDISDEWERKCLMYAKNTFEAVSIFHLFKNSFNIFVALLL